MTKPTVDKELEDAAYEAVYALHPEMDIKTLFRLGAKFERERMGKMLEEIETQLTHATPINMCTGGIISQAIQKLQESRKMWK